MTRVIKSVGGLFWTNRPDSIDLLADPCTPRPDYELIRVCVGNLAKAN